jgi:hypothetical protein
MKPDDKLPTAQVAFKLSITTMFMRSRYRHDVTCELTPECGLWHLSYVSHYDRASMWFMTHNVEFLRCDNVPWISTA